MKIHGHTIITGVEIGAGRIFNFSFSSLHMASSNIGEVRTFVSDYSRDGGKRGELVGGHFGIHSRQIR